MEQQPKPQRVKKPIKKIQKEVKKVEKDVKKMQKQHKNSILSTERGEAHFKTHMTPAQEERMVKRLQRRMKQLECQENGPKVQSVMKTTVTLGAVTSSDSDTLARHMRVWLSPVLMKPNHSGEIATPLTTRASQYNLWRAQSVTIKVTPLASQAVLSGTLLLVDIDQESSSAKPDTVDSVKARPHIEMPIGKARLWKVPPRSLRGPRSGWWYVDTNEDPSQSLGPAINVWTYIKTVFLVSTQESKNYDGPIFLLELTATYQFSNYNPKPALATMETVFEEHNESGTDKVQLITGTDGDLQMEVDEKTALARATAREAGADGKKSDTLWAVGSKVVDTVSGALGPWGWLLKGGWWVIRKIFKRDARAAGKLYFQVYPSVEDASKDNPIYLPSPIAGQTLPVGYYFATQLNSQNLQSGPQIPQQALMGVEIPGYPIIPPCPEPEPKILPWLPQSWATADWDVPPPIYIRRSDGTFSSQYSNNQGENCWCAFTGSPEVTIVQETLNTGGLLVQKFKYSWNVWGVTKADYEVDLSYITSPLKQAEKFFWFDLRQAGKMEGFSPSQSTPWRTYGVVHTMPTIIKSLKHGGVDPSGAPWMRRPWSVFRGTWEMDRRAQRQIFGDNFYPRTDQTTMIPVYLYADTKYPAVMIIDQDFDIAGILTTDIMVPSDYLKRYFFAVPSTAGPVTFDARWQPLISNQLVDLNPKYKQSDSDFEQIPDEIEQQQLRR